MTYYHELTFCSTYKKYSIAIVIEYVPKKRTKMNFSLNWYPRSYISAENCLTFVDQEHLGLEIGAQIVIVERKCHLHEFF